MLFTQIEFFLLFGLVLLACALLRSHAALKWVLLIASLYFYAYWDVRFVGLMLACITVNYTAARYLDHREDDRSRKWIAGVAIGLSLLGLGVFKYHGFFLENVQAAVDGWGMRVPALDLVLPVGISFFTFQALSYTLDVYRRDIPATHSWRDVALYISFFPQLVAGPIVRAAEFMPQLDQRPRLSWERAGSGTRQFVRGLFKKAFIADQLAGFVDFTFSQYTEFSGLTLFVALVAYTVQIYCDFSGYSDMAIGTARFLGYDFSENFRHPYLSRSITEFWRRWHISLSTWLRDYLYIPLGGNRKGRRRTCLNLLLTMLLGGLWHGAAWTFVIWGAWHGAWLAGYRFWATKCSREPMGASASRFNWLLTMTVVMLGWLLFRASSLEQFWGMLVRMVSAAEGITWIPWMTLCCIGLVVGRHLLLLSPRWERAFGLEPGRAWTAFALTVMAGVAWLFAPEQFHPFIYFQF